MTDLDELKAKAEAVIKRAAERSTMSPGEEIAFDMGLDDITEAWDDAANPKTILALIERLEKAEGALRYYADPENWEYKNVGETVYIEMCPIQSDKGETANRALGGDNHE